MKKRYKGYFKKPTNVLEPSIRNYIDMKQSYSKNGKFRIALWVKFYLSEIIK